MITYSKKTSNETQETIEKAISYGLIKLLGKDFNNVNIKVKYIKRAYHRKGLIRVINNDYKSMVLIINKLILEDKKQLLETIFHELTHVKQLYNRQLMYIRIGTKSIEYWNGKRLPNRIAYLDKPYEVEARQTSVTLSCEYKKMYN